MNLMNFMNIIDFMNFMNFMNLMSYMNYMNIIIFINSINLMGLQNFINPVYMNSLDYFLLASFRTLVEIFGPVGQKEGLRSPQTFSFGLKNRYSFIQLPFYLS